LDVSYNVAWVVFEMIVDFVRNEVFFSFVGLQPLKRDPFIIFLYWVVLAVKQQDGPVMTKPKRGHKVASVQLRSPDLVIKDDEETALVGGCPS
jgi:hypothetical protein